MDRDARIYEYTSAANPTLTAVTISIINFSKFILIIKIYRFQF